MAIDKVDGVSAVTVATLLQQNLCIPDYQRPYSWRVATALQLVDDVWNALHDPVRHDVPYVLGAVILHRDDGRLYIVDGQQRLLTLRMILAQLDTVHYPMNLPAQGNTPVALVWSALQQRLVQMDRRDDYLRFICHQCQMVRIVTDDIDEAFRVFDSQNYRGKALAPHDLLKAHHLREMRDESAAAKVAIVEAWESVSDSDLDRLFSTFLYRIAKWSRGESALEFSAQDIGMFKGISVHPARTLTPHQRYHVAAQAVIPLLNGWAATVELDARDAGRSRFQLDAPIIAGRAFFEMVGFMLGELKSLEQEVAASGMQQFGGERSRYRYVYELFIAALLSYTNKFGTEDLPAARKQLFVWAYSLRLELLRVQFVSADNRARGKGDSQTSAFIVLRNAINASAIRHLADGLRPVNAQHEKELQSFIARLQ
ncbi:DUF262 domain-containing protein [Pseudoduganella danionis]|uniref:DUF262 domain-containing protein n=1 Tax=Pseudoduganella danionis TaxID=1890295 RepID=UPI0035B03112